MRYKLLIRAQLWRQRGRRWEEEVKELTVKIQTCLYQRQSEEKKVGKLVQ